MKSTAKTSLLLKAIFLRRDEYTNLNYLLFPFDPYQGVLMRPIGFQPRLLCG